jgi:hypothetical protein
MKYPRIASAPHPSTQFSAETVGGSGPWGKRKIAQIGDVNCPFWVMPVTGDRRRRTLAGNEVATGLGASIGVRC